MSDSSSSGVSRPGDASAGLPLLEALAAANSQPLWDRFARFGAPEPPYREPVLWPWSTMSALADRAVREVSMEDAERRVLLLAHPDMPEACTSSTFLCGLQILAPGESARPHRHSVAALRLVMEGQGAVTTVDGKPCPMEPGDLVLTPSWCWHEHTHGGSGRMVWFDGLDQPLARYLGTLFFEGGPPRNEDAGLACLPDTAFAGAGILPDGYAHSAPHSPLYRYPWRTLAAALDALPPEQDGSRRIRYVNPATGGAVMPTIDCYALRPGQAKRTQPLRTTSHAVAVAMAGAGTTLIGAKTIEWKQHDVLTLPRWQWIEHEAATPGATLFLMTDRQWLAASGYLREERGEPR